MDQFVTSGLPGEADGDYMKNPRNQMLTSLEMFAIPPKQISYVSKKPLNMFWLLKSMCIEV